MRFCVGRLPADDKYRPSEMGWRPLESSGDRRAYLKAGAAGLLLALCLFSALAFFSIVAGGLSDTPRDAPFPWLALLGTPVLAIVGHEALHLVWHPEGGRSPRSVVIVWPRRLRFGVYFDGCLSRRRWLVMRLTPLLLLAVVPTAVLALSATPLPYQLETALILLLIFNSIGSGGDLAAVRLVLRQVPAGAHLCFCNGRAYWRPA